MYSSEKNYAKGVAEVALLTAITVICSWISIPVVIPFTLQTFAIFLGICVLGEKKATFALIAYLLLGIIGVPVFAGFQSGAGVIVGPTGGFVLGFLFIPLISYAFSIFIKNKWRAKIIGMALGVFLCYILGALWFYFVAMKNGGQGFTEIVATCVIPFIIPDALKLILAITVSKTVNKAKRQ